MSTAKDLQNMVTGILAADTEEEEIAADENISVLDMLPAHGSPFQRKSAEPLLALEKGRELEDFLRAADPKKSQEEVRDKVAFWAASRHAESNHYRSVVRYAKTSAPTALETFALLHDYLREPSRERLDAIYHFVRGFNNRLELSQELRYKGPAQYLQEKWGEDTAERLHQITGTSKATVKKWLAGSMPSESNKSKLIAATSILFALEKDCLMSEEEAEEFLFASQDDLGGASIFDEMAASGSYWIVTLQISNLVQKTYQERNGLFFF